VAGLSINLRGEHLILLPLRAVYWPGQSCLFIADLHLGKARHFRKEGIGVPEAIGEEDYSKLYDLLKEYSVDDIYFLGDLFHSEHNKEWEKVEEMVQYFSRTTFHLILGNHDILKKSLYQKAGLEVYDQYLDLGPFKLTHEPPEVEVENEKFIFCGHIHPGIGIKGKGRQHVRLPCFYSHNYYMILPAYGTFTGVKTLTLSEGNIAYAILKDKVIPIKENYSKRKNARG
tara:strand:+ start:410 stop:1096 length:687 start_codon:yes stop_codon:yes gene_type:complete